MDTIDTWNRDGYLLEHGMFGDATIAALTNATEHAFAQWREQSTPENQPGGFAWGPAAWVMLHVNHATYYRDRDDLRVALLDAIAQPNVVALAGDIFGEPAMFMQASFYIDPPEEPTAQGGRWHRDCEFFARDKAHEAELVEAEASPPREIHLHIPLVPTQATSIVPGSHDRQDAPAEAHARATNAYGDMPGGKRLPMRPGDLGVFHVNSIHRGHYEVGVKRRTIALTFGAASRYRAFDANRWAKARAYVCGIQPWMNADGYLDGVRPETRAFFEAFIGCYREQWRDDIFDADVIGADRVAYYTQW